MTFYISCRPFRYRKEIISPKECLKYNFPELKFEFRCIGFNCKLDGRWLYEIISDEDVQEALIRGLAAFGAEIVETADAKKLAEKTVGCKFSIKENRLEVKS